MANDEMKQIWKVPEPTLRRLPWYLAFLKLMKGRGEAFVSSTQIAKEINVDPSQVAKDLSFVNISGKTRVGYEISTLVDVLEDFLGFTAQHKAFLFGVGSLGAALLQDSGLKQYGLEIVEASMSVGNWPEPRLTGYRSTTWMIFPPSRRNTERRSE